MSAARNRPVLDQAQPPVVAERREERGQPTDSAALPRDLDAAGGWQHRFLLRERESEASVFRPNATPRELIAYVHGQGEMMSKLVSLMNQFADGYEHAELSHFVGLIDGLLAPAMVAIQAASLKLLDQDRAAAGEGVGP